MTFNILTLIHLCSVPRSMYVFWLQRRAFSEKSGSFLDNRSKTAKERKWVDFPLPIYCCVGEQFDVISVNVSISFLYILVITANIGSVFHVRSNIGPLSLYWEDRRAKSWCFCVSNSIFCCSPSSLLPHQQLLLCPFEIGLVGLWKIFSRTWFVSSHWC